MLSKISPQKIINIFLTKFFIYIFGINLDILSTSWHIFYKIIFSLCPTKKQQHKVMSAQMSKLPEAIIFLYGKIYSKTDLIFVISAHDCPIVAILIEIADMTMLTPGRSLLECPDGLLNI